MHFKNRLMLLTDANHKWCIVKKNAYNGRNNGIMFTQLFVKSVKSLPTQNRVTTLSSSVTQSGTSLTSTFSIFCIEIVKFVEQNLKRLGYFKNPLLSNI